MLLSLEEAEIEAIEKKAQDDRMKIVFSAGLLLNGILMGIHEGDFEELKKMLIGISSIDPDEVINSRIQHVRPFQKLKIQRFVDPLWRHTMLSDSNIVDMDTNCLVKEYKGDIYLRWTIPDPATFEQCDDPKKLIFTAMTVIEEMLHICQIEANGARKVMSLELILDLKTQGKTLTEQDSDLLTRILESDVTYFLASKSNLFGKCIPDLEETQWYKKRFQGEKIHRPMSPDEMFEGIMHLAEKYDDPMILFSDFIGNSVGSAQRNPELVKGIFMSEAFLSRIAQYSKG